MKKYMLENLDCPFCAAKIEEGIKNLDCVKDAKVVFATKTLMIDTDNIHKVQEAVDEIEKGVVKCEIDPKFSQALGIGSIESIISMLKHCKWEILLNRSYSSEFYTSDFPIAIEPIKGFFGMNRIFPLSPLVAVRICITDESCHVFNDFPSPKFHYQIKRVGYKDIVKINKLTIQCAEVHVFFRNMFQGIETFLTKNALYNLIDDTQSLNTNNGKYIEVKTKINKKAP